MTGKRVRGKRRTFRLTTRNKVIGLALIVGGSWLLTGFLLTPSAPQGRDHFDVNFKSPGVTVVIPPGGRAPAPDTVIDTGVIEATPGSEPAPDSPRPVNATDAHKSAL